MKPSFDPEAIPSATRPLSLIRDEFEKAVSEEEVDSDFQSLDGVLRGESGQLETLKVDVPKFAGDELEKNINSNRRAFIGSWISQQIAKGQSVESLASHAESAGDARTGRLIRSVGEELGL